MATHPTYPPNLSKEELDFLLTEIANWSILRGLAVRPPESFVPKTVDPSGALAVTAPVTLFPSLFPRECFDEARAIQTAYNELYAAIARDEEWLSKIVEELVEVDDFIKDLWDVHRAVKREGYVQDLSLGIFRSDYMIDHQKSGTDAKAEIKQVEFNTIASSFGGLASKVSALHRHLLNVGAFPKAENSLPTSAALPIDPSIERIAAGLADSHKAYGSSRSQPSLPLCVLFVVQEHENNIFDQLAISVELQSIHNIPIFRLPFQHAAKFTKIPSDNISRPLVYTPPHSPTTAYEATTLYFRAGYSPGEYTFPEAWQVRLHLERSAAIKCPSILTHLAGSKKIQQILATPSSPYLEHFLSKTSYNAYIDRTRATFAAIYPLDDTPSGQEALKIARDSSLAKKYVLKPQREGGGNNIYGEKIPPFLASLGDTNKYKGYILMELIEPPPLRNFIFRNGMVKSGEVIGELGIYGVCLWRNGEVGGQNAEVLVNYEGGFLLRTKGRESEEGGVAAGFGAVDSVCLV